MMRSVPLEQTGELLLFLSIQVRIKQEASIHLQALEIESSLAAKLVDSWFWTSEIPEM